MPCITPVGPRRRPRHDYFYPVRIISQASSVAAVYCTCQLTEPATTRLLGAMGSRLRGSDGSADLAWLKPASCGLLATRYWLPPAQATDLRTWPGSDLPPAGYWQPVIGSRLRERRICGPGLARTCLLRALGNPLLASACASDGSAGLAWPEPAFCELLATRHAFASFLNTGIIYSIKP